MRDTWHLGEADFFDDDPEAKKDFLAAARRRVLKKKDIVFFEEDEGDSCFYLERGLVKIFQIAASGKEPIFFLRRQGEMFGLAEVLDSEARKANAMAMAPCVLHEIKRERFILFLDRHPCFARKVIKILGRRLRYLGDQLANVMICDVETRLVKLLVYLAYEDLGDEKAWVRPVRIPVRLTQAQMASMTGSCQQTVSESLKQLQKDGLIEASGREIWIPNPLKLLERAER